MATKQKAGEGQVKARILVDCDLGKINEVVVVDEAALKGLVGVVDADPAAVSYAESLA